jgi:hypothetical protein
MVGCGAMFTTDNALDEHYTSVHDNAAAPASGGTRMSPMEEEGKRKRKFLDEDILPVIEVMPINVAKRKRVA